MVSILLISINTKHRSLGLKAIYVSGAVSFKFVSFVHYPVMLLIFIIKMLVSYKSTHFHDQFMVSLYSLFAVCTVCIFLWSFV